MQRKPGAADRDDNLVLGFFQGWDIFQILSYNTKLNDWKLCVQLGKDSQNQVLWTLLYSDGVYQSGSRKQNLILNYCSDYKDYPGAEQKWSYWAGKSYACSQQDVP